MEKYRPLPTVATPPPKPSEARIRVCKVCDEPKPLDARYYRPRRIGEAIYLETCRVCERAARSEQAALQAETSEENTLLDPNHRILKEYIPERIDEIEIAALKAADERGVEFASDTTWSEFCETVALLASWGYLNQPNEFYELAVSLLEDRN